ncbi:MAG: transcriptional repressor LexA [Anaerolineae bacterium]
MALSERQKGILKFIADFLRRHGYPPTIREIGAKVGISSTSVVNYNLGILERDGYIERDREISRGIRLPGGLASLSGRIQIPLCGRIAAGDPIPIPDDSFPTETIELTRDILKEEEGLYALEVKGDSMIDALVHDGDIVIMKHQKEAENGEMVAVWLRDKGETTLKKIYHEGERVRLQPANPLLEPIYVHPGDVEIQGKVMVVIRRLQASPS